LHHQGKHTAAEEAYRCALLIEDSTPGKDSFGIPIILGRLARLAQDQGTVEKVEYMYRKVSIKLECSVGPYNQDVLETLEGLAIVVQRKGQKVEAEKLRYQEQGWRLKSTGGPHEVF
jgi:hypothetical protein